MSKKSAGLLRALPLAATVVAAVLLPAVPAMAAGGVTPAASEDLVPIPAPIPPKGEQGPEFGTQAEYCTPGTYLYSMTNTTNTFDAKFRTSVINNTSSAKSFKFTATKTGTTTFTVSVSVSAELKAAIFAKMETTINAGVEQSNTTSYGVEVSGTVNANSTLYGDYGNWKENVSWKSHYVYSNCNTASENSGSAYAPYREAWKLYY
ncbi:hypothetical protein ACLQ3D_18285 [Micromonospora vinacea]|uniref:hypothetical protein n=1 Tax=Micromonospora TaxID=1873 RepID=UPI00386DABB5|nr:hypothetical protein OH804_29945 [Micromonospora sp. NBC_00860]WTA67455.1 hypothetical protein OHB51_34370 [Micromonospora sp. NBC_00855]